MTAAELARSNSVAIRDALAKTGQARVAEQLGCSESKISRWKDSEADQVGALLAACGLRVVGRDDPYVDEDHLIAITILARETLNKTGWGGK